MKKIPGGASVRRGSFIIRIHIPWEHTEFHPVNAVRRSLPQSPGDGKTPQHEVPHGHLSAGAMQLPQTSERAHAQSPGGDRIPPRKTTQCAYPAMPIPLPAYQHQKHQKLSWHEPDWHLQYSGKMPPPPPADNPGLQILKRRVHKAPWLPPSGHPSQFVSPMVLLLFKQVDGYHCLRPRQKQSVPFYS